MGVEVSTGPSVRLLVGHVLDQLRSLPEDSTQCVVTSPPYRIGACGITRGADARRLDITTLRRRTGRHSLPGGGKGYIRRTLRILNLNPTPTAPSATAPARTIPLRSSGTERRRRASTK